MNPKVSICIPTYNGAKFIAEAMESAIHQSYENLEIIVSDDASKDCTLEIIEGYKAQTTIPICIYHHEPNGIGANWNHAIKHSKGDYIKFLFQDDVLEPDCVKEMVAAFQKNKQLGMVTSKREFIVVTESCNDKTESWIANYGDLQAGMQLKYDNGVGVINKSLFKLDSFLKSPLNMIGEPSVYMFKKDLIKEVGWFREDLKQILDYEFCYRVLKKQPIAIINKPLVKFRIHPLQATNVNRGNDIGDYAIYNKLIYTDYFWYVNSKTQKRLLKKYNKPVRMFIRIKNKIKSILYK